MHPGLFCTFWLQYTTLQTTDRAIGIGRLCISIGGLKCQNRLRIVQPSKAALKLRLTFLCLSHTSSDLQGIRTMAKKDGSDWILNGSKTFITNGFMSDVVIVVAVTDPKAKSIAHGISLFLVDADTPGFKKGRKLEKMGLKAQVDCFPF